MTAAEMHGISRALSDPRRFDILKRIASQNCAACAELRDEFPITAATLSHHLKELESCGLVQAETAGEVYRCDVSPRCLKTYLKELKNI